MAKSEPMVAWTCDRCGLTMELSRGQSPIGWRHTAFDYFGRSLDDNHARHFDLCVECHSAVVAEIVEYPGPSHG